jgi:hypothetical protein
MLFLAVFAGFIAENIRENLTERKREKTYIRSLVDDLQKDTLMLGSVSKGDARLTYGQDSLIDILNDLKDTGNIVKKCYRYYFLYTTAFAKMEFNQSTMRQLLNSGNMRLIEKPGISDSIMNYNLVVNGVEEMALGYKEYFIKTLDLSASIFDFTLARGDLHDDNTVSPKTSKGLANPKLLTTDPAMIKKYTIELALSKAILQGYVISMRMAKKKAISLITLLKKKYDL